ncbi:hypothetical protein [Nostoc sp. PCC 9305]|uniref:hypothetical protein n=1 Tax=Nostoc sp. PCC 9305 TaxID=296636 RepID=UPI0039C703D9
MIDHSSILGVRRCLLPTVALEETARGCRLLVGTPYHLYYVFSSPLLASCM